MSLRCSVIGAILLAVGCSRPPAGPQISHGHTAAEWVETLRGPDVRARRKAVTALAHLGATDPVVVPALSGALRDTDAEVRDAAAMALFNLGPAAKDAAPALEAAQQDRDPKVRDHVAKALAQVRKS